MRNIAVGCFVVCAAVFAGTFDEAYRKAPDAAARRTAIRELGMSICAFD